MARQFMEQLTALKKVTDRLVQKQEGGGSNSKDEEKEPCSKHILDVVLPKGCKMPDIPAYTRNTNPRDHLSR